MPTRVVIDQIAELAKGIGDIYDAVQEGIGDDATPGSAIYTLSQLQSLATNGEPKFGFVYGVEGPDSNFVVTYDPSDPYFVQVSGGQVAYNGSRLQIAPSKVPIKFSVASKYPNEYAYGMLIGFPISEADKAIAVNTTTVSEAVAGNSQVVKVASVQVAQTLGFPLQAQVGGYFVRFSGVNATNDGLIVDPGYFNGTSYGVTPNFTIPIGSRVYFIYEPRLRPIFGLPTDLKISTQKTYDYYPFMPDDWLPVARVLLENVNDPIVSGSPYEIERTAIIYPALESGSTLFDAENSVTIARSSVSTRSALHQAKDNASVDQLLGALEQYTAKIAQDTQTSFSTYWSKQPFRPTSYFARCVSFEGIERMDFSNSFKNAYYKMRKQDLVQTFAVFRGDLYEFSSVLTGTPPTTANAYSYSIDLLYGLDHNISLARGSYVYGVSALTSSGETVPTYCTVRSVSATPGYFFNHIEWTQVTGATSYHVYRRAKSGIADDPASQVGDYSEFRLTEDNEVRGYGTFTQANITYATANQLDNTYEAFKFVATGSFLQGVSLRFRRGPSAVNSSNSIVVRIRSNSGSNKPSSVISSDFIVIPFDDLATTWKDFTLVFQHGGIALTAGATYWISITTTLSIGVDVVEMLVGSQTGTGTYATSPDATTWTLVNDVLPYYKLLYGFVDNGQVGVQSTRRGIKLTGFTSRAPQRLRVYVPPVEDLINGRDPDSLASGDLIQFSTDSPESTITRNEINVIITARNGLQGTPKTFVVNVPQGTPRDTEFLIGNELDIFDRVDDVQVRPGTLLRRGSQNQILWHMYDLVTVETCPHV